MEVLGSRGAARKLYREFADDESRMVVFAAHQGEEVQLILRSGEVVSGHPGEVGKTLAQLDELAALSDDVGVDLFLDQQVLRRWPDLNVGPNTRLWVVLDDVPRQVRRGPDGVARVSNALFDRQGEPRFWVRMVDEASDLLLEILDSPVHVDRVVVHDADCEDQAGVEWVANPLDAVRPGAGTVVLLSDADLPATFLEAARIGGTEVVAIGGIDTCDPSGAPGPGRQALDDALGVRRWGDLVALAMVGERPDILDATRTDRWLSVHGDGVRASLLVQRPTAPTPGPPPWWVLGLGLGFGGILGVGAYRWARRS